MTAENANVGAVAIDRLLPASEGLSSIPSVLICCLF